MLIVFGSVSIDMIFHVDALPKNGESVVASSYSTTPGGKGANQALAAARCDVKTALVSKVGDDSMGNKMLLGLRGDGVLTSGVGKVDSMLTGSSIISVDKKGIRRTVIAACANNEVTEDQIPDEILLEKNVVLAQMEVPVEQTAKLLERAKARGTTTILNLAPALSITKEMLDNTDFLIVNQIEAEQLGKAMGLDAHNDPAKIARTFADKADLTCIVTLGGEGLVAAINHGATFKVPSLKIGDVIDKTGAGDAFCGTLAAGIHDNIPLEDALKRAVVAGGLACKKLGAQPSFPYKQDVTDHLEELGDIETL